MQRIVSVMGIRTELWWMRFVGRADNSKVVKLYESEFFIPLTLGMTIIHLPKRRT